MKILGVDPGLRTSGYAVITQQGHDLRVLDAGALKADEQLPLAQRLQQIYNDIDALLVEHDPDLMAVEELYSHYQHPRTAILMAHARAVFLLSAARHDISVHGFSATRIKKFITGNGRASKQQIQKAVQTQLNLAKIPTPADVADALAVAMCCLNEHNRESVLL